jgi:hypothetical protein
VEIAISGHNTEAKHNSADSAAWLALASQMVSELFKEILEGAKNGNIETPMVRIVIVTITALASKAQ